MSNNYENKILDAIQTIVENAVSKANYDKTIKGVISKCSDKSLGKYVVKYQDSSFYAYAADTSVTYTAGTSVYVLVPGNDMSQTKTIIGTVDKLGIDYVNIIESSDGYEVIGNNTITSDAEFGLCSYTPGGDAIVLFDQQDKENALININEFAVAAYLQQSDYLICGASFKTNLKQEQQYKGDYGLAFDLIFSDNNTGEDVLRTYLVNINQMKGNPYNFSNFTEQKVVFEIDGENFKEISKIYAYGYNFPNSDENITEKDIFFRDIILEAAEALSDEEIAGNALTLITPQGIYFDDNDTISATRKIQAQTRINNDVIDDSIGLTKYYWFKENNKINTSSLKYNRYGGLGWECLNDYNIIDDEVIEWIAADSTYVIKKDDNKGKENTYKCVCVYNDSLVLSKNVTIYNYSSTFDISIVSDSGIYFSYDVGHPTLTCLVNNGTPNNIDDVKWEFNWGVTDNNNIFSVLEETSTRNTEYNNAVKEYTELSAEIASGIVLNTEANQTKLSELAYTISQYKTVMRVEGNKIYNLKLNTITNFSTYTCLVYRNDEYIGKSSITIVNDLNTDKKAYTLVINGGNQVFKYNEKGIAPTSKSLENPQELYPLSFTLYDDQGQEISENAIKAKDIYWTVPTDDSLITISAVHGNPISTNEIDETATYTEYRQLYFTIANQYNAASTRNTIQLTVTYKDKIISAYTDLLFIKEGESGANGTNFVCRIAPNSINEVNSYPTVTYDENSVEGSDNPTLNFTPRSSDIWFKAELWHDGVQIFDGTTSGNSTEDKKVKINWEMLANTYTRNLCDYSNFEVDASTGKITFDSTEIDYPANILKCTLTYDDVDYYATMPIILVRVKNSAEAAYTASLEKNTGFRYAMYTTDGQTPAYDSANPFRLKITQTIDGIAEDISTTVLPQYQVDYNWSVKGQVYNSEWDVQENLIEKRDYTNSLKVNEKNYKPIDVFNGYSVNNAVYCSITRGGDELLNIHIPIHLYLNKYGNSAMNGWDGNHIQIDEDGGFILAPQVGAGKKNDDNSFTGVFMGQVQEAGKSNAEYGLFGYNEGERTIALNAEDGSAKFGKAGKGQIILDPTDDTAVLRSGDYVAPTLDEEGNIVESGSGLEIDLTDPHITFGSGKFRVDKDGNVSAIGYATVNDLNEINDNAVKSVKVFYALSNSETEEPTDGWSMLAPEWTDGKYMWQKTVTTYLNGDVQESAATCISGAKGDTGYSGYSILVSNEAQILQADSNGHVSNYDSANTTIQVYQGTTNLTLLDEIGISPVVSGVIGTFKKDEENQCYVYQVTELVASNGFVDFVITRDAETIGYARYTLAKTYAAASYYIMPSAASIIKSDNILTPNKLSFGAYTLTSADSNGEEYLGRWLVEYTEDGEEWKVLYESKINESYCEVTPTAKMKIIRAYLGLTGQEVNPEKALDFQSIPILVSSGDISIGGINLLSVSEIDSSLDSEKNINLKETTEVQDMDSVALIQNVLYGNTEQESGITFDTPQEVKNVKGITNLISLSEAAETEKKNIVENSLYLSDDSLKFKTDSETMGGATFDWKPSLINQTDTYTLGFNVISDKDTTIEITSGADGETNLVFTISANQVYTLSTQVRGDSTNTTTLGFKCTTAETTISFTGLYLIKGVEEHSSISATKTSLFQIFTNKQGERKDFSIDLTKDNDYLIDSYELCKIDDVYDEYDVTSGILTQRIGKTILYGFENWTLDSDEYKVTKKELEIEEKSGTKIICNYFTDQDIKFDDTSLCINYNNGSEDVDKFKQLVMEKYALGNPIVLYYILDEEQKIQLTAGTTIPYEGFNNISFDKEGSDINCSITYQKGTHRLENFIFTETSWGAEKNEGLEINNDIFEDGSQYSLSYKLEVLDGNIITIGGQASEDFYELIKYSVDGEEYFDYNTPVELNDGIDIHNVIFIFTYHDTENRKSSINEDELNLFIQPNCEEEASYWKAKIYNIKVERGNMTTDWSPASDDLKTTIQNLYCYTDSLFSIPLLPDNSNSDVGNITVNWQESTNIQSSGFLWQTTKVISGADTSYVTPAWIGIPKVKIVYNQFLKTTSKEEPAENDSRWANKQPEWDSKSTIEYTLWVRTATIYEGVTDTVYSTPYIDTNWGATTDLNTALNDISDLVSGFTSGEGTVTMNGGEIVVKNNDNTQQMVINANGISFRVNGKDTTAWSIGGTIAGQYITAQHLQTDLLTNNSIVIGANYEDTQNTGTFILRDRNDIIMVSIAPEDTDVDVYAYDEKTGERIFKETITVPIGTKFYNEQGFCHTEITREEGIKGYRRDVEGNEKTIYEVQDDTFAMDKGSASTSFVIGNVEIKAVSGSHNGIAFVHKG